MAENIQPLDQCVLELAKILDASYYDFVPRNASTDLVQCPRTHALLFPTGAYAARLWQPGDDVHLVLMTSNSARVFWAMAFEKLGIEESKLQVKDAQILVPMSSFADGISTNYHLSGAQLYLHYCTFPQNFEASLIEQYGFPDFCSKPKASAETKNLQMLQTAWHLFRFRTDGRPEATGGQSEVIEGQYEAAYFLVRSWAITVGIFSKSFGYLDSESLIWMVWRGFEDWKCNKETMPEPFLHYLFRKAHHFIDMDASVSSAISAIQADDKELPTACTGWKANQPRHITLESGIAIVNNFAKIQFDSNITDALQIPSDEGFRQFIKAGDLSFVRFDASSWGKGSTKREQFGDSLVSILESTILLIRQWTLSEHRYIARIWPRPMIDEENPQCCIWTYIIGIWRVGIQKEAAALESLDKLARSLTERLQYDRETAYISISSATADEILALTPPPAHKIIPFLSNTQPGQPEHQSREGHRDSLSKSTKFRTASSALSRLRFDPAHARFEYEVGYLDRFEGLKWLALEQWGQKATEEEDCIPMHRVQILRRLGDGFVVWDRDARVDLTG